MSIQRSIYDRLRSNATISGLIGTRIYPGLAPLSAGTDPYIAYSVRRSDGSHSTSGAEGLVFQTVTINCVDNDGVTAHALAEAVRDSIDGYRGDMGTSPNTTDVRGCWLENDDEQFGDPSEGSDIPRVTRVMVFEVAHRETVPTLA